MTGNKRSTLAVCLLIIALLVNSVDVRKSEADEAQQLTPEQLKWIVPAAKASIQKAVKEHEDKTGFKVDYASDDDLEGIREVQIKSLPVSIAEATGLKIGDVIIHIDGQMGTDMLRAHSRNVDKSVNSYALVRREQEYFHTFIPPKGFKPGTDWLRLHSPDPFDNMLALSRVYAGYFDAFSDREKISIVMSYIEATSEQWQMAKSNRRLDDALSIYANNLGVKNVCINNPVMRDWTQRKITTDSWGNKYSGIVAKGKMLFDKRLASIFDKYFGKIQSGGFYRINMYRAIGGVMREHGCLSVEHRLLALRIIELSEGL